MKKFKSFLALYFLKIALLLAYQNEEIFSCILLGEEYIAYLLDCLWYWTE
jgi:hypothetical protein